MGLIVF